MAGWPAAKSAEVPTECLSLAERGGLRGEHATLGEGDYRSFLRKRNGSIGRCRSAPYRAMVASSATSCGPNHARGGGSASVSQTVVTESAHSIVDPTLPLGLDAEIGRNSPAVPILARPLSGTA